MKRFAPFLFKRGDTISIFDAVKSGISTKQAVEFYGIELNRGGFARCPFHADGSPPSFKVYDNGFYCFGCHEHGNVIDFVSKLFILDAKDAAKKLTADFGINDVFSSPSKPILPCKSENQRNREKLNENWDMLCDYLQLLRD
ncbi:MAG: CHC2 zinc finger domain-containing protein [Smithella sp.]